MILLKLFFEFFKVGLFSIGGGLATIPFLSDIADRTHWFTRGDIADMIAISESTPGPIGVNMATFAGYKTAGVPGGIVSTLGLIVPAIIMIYIVIKILTKFMGNKYVDSAFYGLRPASMALIASAGFGVMKLSLFNIDSFLKTYNISDLFIVKGIILAAVILAVQKIFKKVNPILLIFASAFTGIIFNFAS